MAMNKPKRSSVAAVHAPPVTVAAPQSRQAPIDIPPTRIGMPVSSITRTKAMIRALRTRQSPYRRAHAWPKPAALRASRGSAVDAKVESQLGQPRADGGPVDACGFLSTGVHSRVCDHGA